MKRSVVLCLSGGMDSSILAIQLRRRVVIPLFFDYRQPSVAQERAAAREVCQQLGIEPPNEIHLPELASHNVGSTAPFFEQRNLLFAVHAGVFALEHGASLVAFGFVANTDPRRFPDATSGIVEEFNRLQRRCYPPRHRIRLIAPVLNLRKSELLRKAFTNGFSLESTYSCYKGGARCGQCDACVAVAGAIAEAHSAAALDFAHWLESGARVLAPQLFEVANA